MKTYRLETINSDIIDKFITWVNNIYGVIPQRFYDVDWGKHCVKDNISFFQVPDTFNIDILKAKKELQMSVIMLDGISFTPKNIIIPLDKLISDGIKEVNEIASTVILQQLPDWKQRNLTARAVELLSLGTNLTTEEQIEWNSIQEQWTFVKTIRDKSNIATASISLANNENEITSAIEYFINSL